MNGKLLGLVRETLIKRYGEETWAAVERAGLFYQFALDQEAEDLPSDALICWLGQDAIPSLGDRYPSLFARHDDLRSFILGLGDELPATPNDHAPLTVRFRYADAPDGSLLVRIQGDTAVCALIEGLIAGASLRYAEPVTLEQLKCRREGDNACVVRIHFLAAADSGEGVAGARAAGGI